VKSAKDAGSFPKMNREELIRRKRFASIKNELEGITVIEINL